ncbi:MAG: hypothetical protein ACREXR_15040 [Gammaproteobacteria bacterium]
MNLSWTDKSGKTAGYKISRGLTGAQMLVIKPDIGNEDSFPDDFPDHLSDQTTEGRTFLYEVRATKLGTNDSPAAMATTTTRPAAPINLVATRVDNGTGFPQFDLSWDNKSTQTNTFRIRRTAPGEPAQEFESKDKNSFSDVFSLTAGREYRYEVRAEVQGFKNNVKEPVRSNPAVVNVTA